MTQITFHGATDTVTGSRHLLGWGGARVLFDCGLFQGPRAIRERNWQPFPAPPAQLDAVVLTHAHLDHSGYLPRLVKEGFGGRIWCTRATADLLDLMLKDSARLQEEEASYANRKGWSRHKPALPLYTVEDAEAALELLEPVPYETEFTPAEGLAVRFVRAGHILGSAFAMARTPAGTVCFGGDLGRYDQSIIPDPSPVPRADWLLLESTYGNRDHQDVDVDAELVRIAGRVCQTQGWILIPSFAIGRAQEVLYLLDRLWAARRLPRIPVYLDSPMAVSAVPFFERHREDHDLEMGRLMDQECSPFCNPNLHFVRTPEESKKLNGMPGPGIIIAGSGMANGGRIRHHLLNKVSDPGNTVLFVGYQAEGTPGRALLEGAERFRAFGWEVPVGARLERLDALSAHADRGEILRWLAGFEVPPRTTYLVHGEPEAREALEVLIRERLGWQVHRPGLHETVAPE